MGRFKEVLFAAIFALAFIFLTGYGATVGSGWLMEFCFMFHLYPFGLGFAGGGGVAVYGLLPHFMGGTNDFISRYQETIHTYL